MRSRVRMAFVALLALIGCTSPVTVKHDGYPIDWPAPVDTRDGCPGLTGRYENADSATGKVLLAALLLPPPLRRSRRLRQSRSSDRATGSSACASWKRRRAQAPA